MLNQTERQGVLRLLRTFCTVAFLPLEVDVNSWELHPYIRPLWKKLLCRVSFALYLLHILGQILSLVNALMFMRGTPLYQIIIHGILASSFAVTSFHYYFLYIKYPGVNAAVVEMSLTGSVAGRK